MKLGDLNVNRIGFGAMRVIENSDIWGPPEDRDNARRVLRRAYELGANFLDTAESYGPHYSEITIAEAMHPYPKDLVIGTKCGLARPKPSRWDEDGRPEKLRQDLEGSLKRLKLERIDVYQLHAPDPKVPFEEQIGALADFQREGKVRHIGLSNVTLKELEQARHIVPIVSVQNRYNLTDRQSEDVLEACQAEEIGFIPWFPLATGKLATGGGVVAGIAEAYAPETLVGRKVVIVANLAPRKLRGLESNGMIVAASPEGGKPVLCSFLEDVPIGSRLK